ncbi:MAG: hypothetical protein ABH851_00735 [Methanobacteriota archaeon]
MQANTNFYLEPYVKKDFKIECIKKNTDQSEVLRLLVRAFSYDKDFQEFILNQKDTILKRSEEIAETGGV